MPALVRKSRMKGVVAFQSWPWSPVMMRTLISFFSSAARPVRARTSRAAALLTNKRRFMLGYSLERRLFHLPNHYGFRIQAAAHRVGRRLECLEKIRHVVQRAEHAETCRRMEVGANLTAQELVADGGAPEHGVRQKESLLRSEAVDLLRRRFVLQR